MKSGRHSRRAYIPWEHMQSHCDLSCMCTSIPVHATRLNSLTISVPGLLQFTPGQPAPRLGEQETEGGQLPPDVPPPCPLPMAPHPTAHYHFPTEAKGRSGIAPGVSQGSHHKPVEASVLLLPHANHRGCVCSRAMASSSKPQAHEDYANAHSLQPSLEIGWELVAMPARTGHSTKVHRLMDTKLTT